MSPKSPSAPRAAKKAGSPTRTIILQSAREAKAIKQSRKQEAQKGRLLGLNTKSAQTGSASFRSRSFNISQAAPDVTSEPFYAVYESPSDLPTAFPITFNLTKPTAPSATAPTISAKQAETLRKAQEAKAIKREAKKEAEAKRMQAVTIARAQKKTNTAIKAAAKVGGGAVNSSNVAQVLFSVDLLELFVQFHNGQWYQYDLSGEDSAYRTYLAVLLGQARCKTDDPTGLHRWWKNKSPSVGAAVWKYLRNTNVPYKKVSMPSTQFAGGSLMVRSSKDIVSGYLPKP